MESTPKILELNAFDMNAADKLPPAVTSLVKRRRKTFGPTSMLFYERPLNLVSAEGVWLHDADGTRYLDAYNNVPSAGHCHPRVVEAVSRQIATLNTHTRYLLRQYLHLCRTPARHDARTRLEHRVHLHRERECRLCLARRACGNGRRGIHRYGERLPRQHLGRDRDIAILGQR